jgi:hypothetical protein
MMIFLDFASFFLHCDFSSSLTDSGTTSSTHFISSLSSRVMSNLDFQELKLVVPSSLSSTKIRFTMVVGRVHKFYLELQLQQNNELQERYDELMYKVNACAIFFFQECCSDTMLDFNVVQLHSITL